MDKQDLDLLLQARTSELQHEYENLVRSLDAAYEAVKAIGRDIAENRSEARRLFDTRLKLARGDDLEAVLRLCGDATTTTTTKTDVTVGAVQGNKASSGRKNDQMVRLYVKPPTQQQQQSDAMAAAAQHVEAVQAQRVVAVTPAVANESLPRVRPIKQTIQPYDAATLLIEQLQYQQKQHQHHQQHEQPQYSPVYVGDDHSYAVNEDEDEDEDLAEHQLMLEERLMIEAGDAKRNRYREGHGGGIDLSIVKTECLENSIEDQNPLVDHKAKITKPVTKNPKIPGTLSKRAAPKNRRCAELSAEDEVNRKRKQTRERMRRWRAKRKMEENAKQAYKYKLVIAKPANV